MPLFLTFAELAYLLRVEGETARKRLHLLSWDPGSPVELSGLASLFARGLLTPDGDGLTPVAGLATVLGALLQPLSWAEIGLAADEGTGGIQIFDGAEARVVAMARPHATFEFEEIDRSEPFPEAGRRMVAEFLEQPGNRTVFLAASPEQSTRGLAIRRRATGEIELAIGGDNRELGEVDLRTALAGTQDYLEQTLASR